jgi:hypothetical protein
MAHATSYLPLEIHGFSPYKLSQYMASDRDLHVENWVGHHAFARGDSKVNREIEYLDDQGVVQITTSGTYELETERETLKQS